MPVLFVVVGNGFCLSTLVCFGPFSAIEAGGEGCCHWEHYPQLRPAVFIGQAFHGAEGERNASSDTCRIVRKSPAYCYIQ